MGGPPATGVRYIMSWPFPDATEQRRLLTTGQVSPSELVEIAIERALASGKPALVNGEMRTDVDGMKGSTYV